VVRIDGNVMQADVLALSDTLPPDMQLDHGYATALSTVAGDLPYPLVIDLDNLNCLENWEVAFLGFVGDIFDKCIVAPIEHKLRGLTSFVMSTARKLLISLHSTSQREHVDSPHPSRFYTSITEFSLENGVIRQMAGSQRAPTKVMIRTTANIKALRDMRQFSYDSVQDIDTILGPTSFRLLPADEADVKQGDVLVAEGDVIHYGQGVERSAGVIMRAAWFAAVPRYSAYDPNIQYWEWLFCLYRFNGLRHAHLKGIVPGPMTISTHPEFAALVERWRNCRPKSTFIAKHQLDDSRLIRIATALNVLVTTDTQNSYMTALLAGYPYELTVSGVSDALLTVATWKQTRRSIFLPLVEEDFGMNSLGSDYKPVRALREHAMALVGQFESEDQYDAACCLLQYDECPRSCMNTKRSIGVIEANTRFTSTAALVVVCNASDIPVTLLFTRPDASTYTQSLGVSGACSMRGEALSHTYDVAYIAKRGFTSCNLLSYSYFYRSEERPPLCKDHLEMTNPEVRQSKTPRRGT
jgi:hypothetical protein